MKCSGCGDVYCFFSLFISEIECGVCVRRFGYGNDKIVVIAIKLLFFFIIFFENKLYCSGCVFELKFCIIYLNLIG